MKKSVNIFVIALFLVFYFTIISYSEIIVMNDGTQYQGNIHHQDDSVVFIVCKEELIKLNKSDIKEIKEDEKNKKKVGIY